MHQNSEKLIELFSKWRTLQLSYNLPDRNLYLNIHLLAGLILTSGICENFFVHWKTFAIPRNNPHFPWASNLTFCQGSYLQRYWWFHQYRKYKSLIPYNPFVAVFTIIANKWGLYAWNFGDVLLCCLSRSLYQKFYLHYKYTKITLETNLEELQRSPKFWTDIITDYDKLTNLLDDFQKLMSPLIFCSTVTNVYFVGITLFNFLESSISPAYASSTVTPSLFFESADLTDYIIWHKIYVAWAFLHLLTRTIVTLMCLARVNVNAHKITRILDKCPVNCWDKRMERMEFRLRTSKVGLNGMGYFTASKPFMLKVINVVFTFEIVLLQPKQTQM